MNQKMIDGIRRWAEIKGFNEGLDAGWTDGIDTAIDLVRDAQAKGIDPLLVLLDLGIKLNDERVESK